MRGLDHERLVLSGGPLGIMRACMDIVVPYVHDRKQFGRLAGNLNRQKRPGLALRPAGEPLYDPENLYGIIPSDPRKPFDVREVIARLVDGGENIYPREVEEFLFTHPDISSAQVFGAPDRQYGEQLCTWIVVRAGARLSEREVIDFCKGRIAHYKIPKYIRFVDQYPMTVTGKIQKFIMRKTMTDELGLVQDKTA